jgi:DNA-binding NtrC family response regulator
VRLEVELLASDQPAPLPGPTLGDDQARHTVLVVAADADVRRYVRECLRDRADLCVLEAAAIEIATRLAALQPPKLLIVDAPDAGVLDRFADVRAVLIADDVTVEAVPNARVTALARPFGARDLQAIVDRLGL